MNPRSPAPKAIDWTSFKEFVYRSYLPKTAYDYLRYSKMYHHLLIYGDFSPLKLLSDSKRAHILKALSSLAKFLGLHREFRSLRESYGLKWNKGNTDQLIINRLLGGNDRNEELESWIRGVKDRVPRISVFVDFITASGLRYFEALNSYNMIIDLNGRNKLREYYENSFLQHFKYPSVFIRRTKKCFLSIVPVDMIRRITKSEHLTVPMIRHRIENKGLNVRFNDLREYWATKMTRYLSTPEIDFLQGRVNSSTFMRHYFNPTLIVDLKKRTLKGIKRLVV